MTISSTTNKSGPYIENGVTTEFEYAFKIEDKTHIQVVRAAGGVETILALGTHYTVTGVGNDKGNVVLNAPASGSTLTLVRDVPFVQELDLENQGAYFAEQVEAALDLAVARDQQLAEKISRAVVVPISADATDLETLIGGVVQLLDSVDAVVTVAGISTQVVAVAANEADVSTVAANIVGVQTTADNMVAILAAPGHASAAVSAAGAAAAAAAASIDAAADAASAASAANAKASEAAGSASAAAGSASAANTKADEAAGSASAAATSAQTATDKAAAAAASAASVDASKIVHVTTDVFSEAQKTIAKNNIGAVGFSAPQVLTQVQKGQVAANIGQAWEHISTVAVGAGTAVVDTTNLGAYRDLRVTFRLLPSENGVALLARLSEDNGGQYNSTVGAYPIQRLLNDNTVLTPLRVTSEDGFNLAIAGSVANGGWFGCFSLFNFNTAGHTFCKMEVGVINIGGLLTRWDAVAAFIGGAPCNAIRLLARSGTIAGSITIEGRRG